ncbi:something about silencing protein 10 [Diaphorina citri]|uniref:Something about silencing protein 10 n=1 Tax=Diaphorina citri TaxID=121845 RepID=A0A3Q0JLC8_DIACI|nr:something about silencing protein 10 [Diaphorina citri]
MGKSKKRKSNVPKATPVDDVGSDAEGQIRFSDSDEDASEKILLDEVLKPKKKPMFNNQDETSIYGIEDSSDDLDEDDENEEEEEEENDGSEEDEDIEDSGAEDDQDLKDELADSDIDGMEEDDWCVYIIINGFLEEEDEVAADLEEQEAMAIQKRLMSEIDATDDVFEFLVQKPKEEAGKDKQAIDQVISKDLSEMSKKEKLQLLEKESPEFQGLVNDFKELMKDVRLHLLPVIQLLEKGKIPPCTAGDSVRLRFELILNYCTNICFYLLLKLKRQSVNHHPIIHRLVATKQLIMKLETIYQDQLLPQIELILTTDNLEVLIDPVLLSNQTSEEEKKEDPKKKKQKKLDYMEDETVMDIDQDEDTTTKRAITYQIAKNKGLTPHRKKELKNPRVKHKLKFRKAKIRRKGQVREPRKELERYGGELSGIKASVRKSIPIK